MNRRGFLASVILLVVAGPLHAAKLKKFSFRIKTKGKSIVGNVLIEAKNVEAAKVRLTKRYPDCKILNVESK